MLISPHHSQSVWQMWWHFYVSVCVFSAHCSPHSVHQWMRSYLRACFLVHWEMKREKSFSFDFYFLKVRDVSSGDHAACYTSALSLHCCFDALALLLCRGKYIQLQVGHIRIFPTRIQPNLSHYLCLSHWAMCCWSEVNKLQWCPALPASIAFKLLLVWSPRVSNKGYRYTISLVQC